MRNTSSSGVKIPLPWYRQENVVEMSRELIGKVLCTRKDGIFTSGIISETEAYAGPVDRASHAYGNRRTARTEVMFGSGGVAYVYLCYGIHHLFNIVTNTKDNPHAILIRGIIPLEGVQHMVERRKSKLPPERLTKGPGTVSQALGIKTSDTGIILTGNTIWLEDREITIPSSDILAGPRIGIDYAGEDALLPWRFLYSGDINSIFVP